MFFRPLIVRLQLILIMSFSLSSCGSLLGAQATPTALQPTPTAVPATSTPPPMVATVNGEGITASEYADELGRYKSAQKGLGRTVTDQEAAKTVLEDLIAQVLLEQGAKAAGFDLTDSALQSKMDAMASQLGGADKLSKWESDHGYTADSFRVALKRDSDAAWMRDKIISAVPTTADQVHVQQILLYNTDQAQRVLEQLKGGADFNTLAATYDPSTRGDLGWFPKGYILDPKVEEAAFGLPIGQYSDVIQTSVGYDIIQVLERDQQHPLSPDAYLVMQEQALKEWLSKQRAQANVVLAPP
jgi:peptidyl-prolyl cis-trans isomerase C